MYRSRLQTQSGDREEKKSLIRPLTVYQGVPNPSVCKLLENRDCGNHSYIPSDWKNVWNTSGTEERLNERMVEHLCLSVVSGNYQNLTSSIKLSVKCFKEKF